jgi:aconitate hydratase 2/2-methylisocitrate dehydratase
MGNGARVYLGSSELAAVVAKHGRMPTVEEYFTAASALESNSGSIYRYLNFHEIEQYRHPRVAMHVIE